MKTVTTEAESNSGKAIRVFVSSTFQDMKAERDHLVTVVWPQIEELLADRGIEFHDIDLRWGVSRSEDDANSWNYCKKSIDATKPFFIALLGERYGYIPRSSLANDPPDHHLQADRSITELEIRHAVLDNPNPDITAFFYHRTTRIPSTTNEEIRAVYVDSPHRTTRLRQAISASGHIIRNYSCTWTNDHFSNLEEFGEKVFSDLRSWIDLKLPESRSHTMKESEYETEARIMQQFAHKRAKSIVGRGAILSRLEKLLISDYITISPLTSLPQDTCILTLYGPSGRGKTTVLCALSERLAHKSNLVITHFAGASTNSTNLRGMLLRFCEALANNGIGDPWTNHHSTLDLAAIKQDFKNRLAENQLQQNVLFFIDALDQLDKPIDLSWLPAKTNPRVRFLLSYLSSRKFHSLLAAHPARMQEFELPRIDKGSIASIAQNYFAQYDKRLHSTNISQIQSLDAARDPLYLRVLVGELRKLGFDINHNRDFLKNMTSDLPNTIRLFDWTLRRLEDLEGAKEALPFWCGYLGASRKGLSGNELAELMEVRFGVSGALASRRIQRALREYLMNRGRALDFFHQQLRVAAEEYANLDQIIVHREMAEYFWDNWDHNDHARSELAFHLTQANDWGRLFQIFQSQYFITKRINEKEGEDLIGDFAHAHNILLRHDPSRAERLAELLALHLLHHEFEVADQHRRFTIDRLSAWFGYRPDYSQFYESVLKEGGQESSSISSSLTADQLRSFRLKCRLRRAGHYRRILSRRSQAEDLLDGLLSSFLQSEDFRSAGSAAYELAYINLLDGDLLEAKKYFHDSSNFAKRGSDHVGAAISSCLGARCDFLRDKTYAPAFEKVLSAAREVFDQYASSSPNARRWRVFCTVGHQFEVAYYRRDPEKTRTCLNEMEGDDWTTSYQKEELMLPYRARQAYLDNDFQKALLYFDEFWKIGVPATREESDGIAYQMLDHGRALLAAGFPNDALEIWRRGFDCEPRNGNAIWHREIRSEWRTLTGDQPENS